MYTLDTNAVIYYLKNDPVAVSSLENILTQSSPIYISSISEVELFGFPKLSIKEAKQIDDILATLSTITLDSQLARTAGFYRRNYHLKIADSVIAATAMFTGTALATRNIRDFKKIPNIKLLKI